jgi:release factor glutamine methyltransferase
MTLIYEPSDDSFLMKGVLEKEIQRLLQENKSIHFLEIGAGSGILLKTARDIGLKNILGSDINIDAINHCKQLGFKMIESDLFEKIKGLFDIIIFNPPYLPIQEGEDKESQLATTGGKDGSEIINKFLKQAKKHLTKNGIVLLLVSSLTKEINWLDYQKEFVGEKKLFFEKLSIWKLSKSKQF